MIFEYIACVGETGKGFVSAEGGYHFGGGGIEEIFAQAFGGQMGGMGRGRGGGASPFEQMFAQAMSGGGRGRGRGGGGPRMH